MSPKHMTSIMCSPWCLLRSLVPGSSSPTQQLQCHVDAPRHLSELLPSLCRCLDLRPRLLGGTNEPDQGLRWLSQVHAQFFEV